MLTLHAILVRNKYREHSESLAYGKAAIEFFNRYGGTPLACPTYKVSSFEFQSPSNESSLPFVSQVYSSHVAVWSVSIAETLPTFRHALAYGLEYRDAEYAGFGCGEYCREFLRLPTL